METRAEREDAVDYVETAKLKTEAFRTPGVVFDPSHLRWSYERCFSQGGTVVALRSGSEKVGQVAMVRQTVMVDGRPEQAAQIIDFFIGKPFRGRDNVRKLYDEVGRQFEQQGIRFAIGMPNAKALGVNAHFFQLMPFLKLPFHVGVALPVSLGNHVVSLRFAHETKEECERLFATYRTDVDENGLPWNARTLAERLGDQDREYGVQATGDVLLISSPRQWRGIPYTLLAGIFARTGRTASSKSVSRAVRAACAMWRRPLYVYVGVNSAVEALPGFAMPVRPSPLMIQLRDFKPSCDPLRIDRFQLLDFDLG